MKLVKEYIYEKFTEDSDPITDLGIGTPVVIDKKIKELLEKDLKNQYTFITSRSGKQVYVNSIMSINILNDDIFIKFYSNKLFDKHHNRIFKKDYIEKLLKEKNLSQFLNIDKIKFSVHKAHGEYYSFYFPIKSEYINSFRKINKEYLSEHEKNGRVVL